MWHFGRCGLVPGAETPGDTERPIGETNPSIYLMSLGFGFSLPVEANMDLWSTGVKWAVAVCESIQIEPVWLEVKHFSFWQVH